MKTYRDNGAIGAILDEYERAIGDLNLVLDSVSPNELVKIVDHETKDEDCRSIQTIMTHVIRAGYCYVISIRNSLGEELDMYDRKSFGSIGEYKVELAKMFQYNIDLFQDYPNIKLEEYELAKKILTSWGQLYDVEQILEHAIVHILRHRRQIERFLIRIR